MKKFMLTAGFLLAIGFATAWAADRQPLSQRISASSFVRTASSVPVIVHNISSAQLPTALLADIKKDYKNYWISELYEDGETRHRSYFITVENADQVIKLSSTDSKSWTVTSTVLK